MNRARQLLKRPTTRDSLLLLALPIVLLLINNNWIFNAPSDFPDDWFYLSYFRHFFAFAPTYPSNIHYFVERLTWNLLGYGFYHVFSPLVANYALHLLVCYVAIFSLYGLLLRLIGRQTALIVALIMGAYPWFLRAVGWDYVDGFGIAQVLLMLYLLTWATQVNWQRARILFFVAGVVCVSIVTSNLFWVGLVPSVLIPYHFINAKNQRHKILFTGIFFVAGCIALTLILAIFYKLVTGNFVFIANSLSFTAKLSGAAAQNNKNLVKYYGQMPPFWHALPVLVGVFAIFSLLRKSARGNWQLRMAVLGYAFAYGFIIFYHFFSMIYLNVYLYSSYVIPSVFILFGVVAAPALQKLTIQQSHWIGVIAVVVLALPLLIDTIIPQVSALQGNLLLVVIAGLVIGAALLFMRDGRIAAVTTIVAAAVLCFLSDPPSVINQVYNMPRFSAQDTFNVVMAFSDQMDQTHDPADYYAFRLWTSKQPDNGTNVGIVAQYLYPWGRTLEGSLLPLPRQMSMYRGMILSSDKDLIIISPKDKAGVLAEEGSILTRSGMEMSIQSQHTIDIGHLKLTYYVARLRPIPNVVAYNQFYWFDHSILNPGWIMPANNPDQFEIWSDSNAQMQFTLPKANSAVQFVLCATKVAVPDYDQHFQLSINDQIITLTGQPDGECVFKFAGTVPANLLANDQNLLTLTFTTEDAGMAVRSFPYSAPAKVGALYKWLVFAGGS